MVMDHFLAGYSLESLEPTFWLVMTSLQTNQPNDQA